MNSVILPQKLKQIISGLLAVWLSGFVFLFCCGTMEFKAAESDSCPLADKGHCAKMPAEQVSSDSIESESTAFDCCDFLSKFFDKNQKSQKTGQVAEIVGKTRIEYFSPAVAKIGAKIVSKYQPLVSNHSDSYLKNCVLII